MQGLYQAEYDSLQSLSQAALAYAREVYHCDLNPQDLVPLDHLLEQEAILHRSPLATSSTHVSLPWLISCFGAWLGQAAVECFGAHWVDLAERHAPRLIVAGIPVSPMDAVERLLLQPSQAVLPSDMFKRFSKWSERERQLNQTSRTQNQRVWDQTVHNPRFVELEDPEKSGEVLPATKDEAIEALDPWLRPLWRPGLKVLCLAAGGGRHAPLLARAGGNVTVIDISEQQLSIDRRWSQTHNVTLRCLRASIDDLSELSGELFNIVIQPVSSCYIPEPESVYRQVAQLTEPGALYLSQHKLAPSMLVTHVPSQQLAFRSEVAGEGPLEPLLLGESHPNREPQTIEYAHGLTTLLGGLGRAGFVIADVQEPCLADAFAPKGSEAWQACFVRPFMKVKCIRV